MEKTKSPHYRGGGSSASVWAGSIQSDYLTPSQAGRPHPHLPVPGSSKQYQAPPPQPTADVRPRASVEQDHTQRGSRPCSRS